MSYLTFSELTKNNRVSKEEQTDAIIYNVESLTDFDVLNFNKQAIDIINRFEDDGNTHTIEIYGKTISEILESIKEL